MKKHQTTFQQSPSLWLRTGRVSESAADYASPVTRPAYDVTNAGHREVFACCIVGFAVFFVWAFMQILERLQ